MTDMTNREKIRILSRVEMSKHYPDYGFDYEDLMSNGKNDELFFDQFSERFFKTSKVKLLYAENFLNRSLHKEGECSINEFYHLIGLTPLEHDEKWRLDDGYIWLDFDHTYVDYEDEYDAYYIVDIIPDPDLYY